MIYKVNIEDIEAALKELGNEEKVYTIQTHVLRKHCNGVVPENYKDENSFRQTIQRKIEDYCPQARDFLRNNNPPKFRRTGRGIYRLYNISEEINQLYPEEVMHPELYSEGATKSISVNCYERSPQARLACIDHFGSSCYICKFDFGITYGEIGQGFIHIHHIVPLAKIGENYKVDPVKDLIPVCPNCHAMLHIRKDTLSVQDLRNIYHHNKA